jgi:hypothetical protein
LFSMTHSMTILPTEFLTAIEMLSLFPCTSMPIYLVREPALKTYSKGAPFYNVWVRNLACANALANSHTSFYKLLG